MSVYVNYGAGSVLYSIYDTPAYTDPTQSQVKARGDAVVGYLSTLEDTADAAAAAAIERINELRSFDAGVGAVQFPVPPAPDVTLEEILGVESLVIEPVEIDYSDLDRDFRYTVKDAINTTFGAPTDVGFIKPPEPGLTTPQPLPNAPADYDFPIPEPPPLDIVTFTPTEVVAPIIDPYDYESGVGDFPIDSLDVVIDNSGLEAAIAAYENYDPTPPTLPEYIYLIPEIFSVTGAMAGGGGLDFESLSAPGKELVRGILGSTAESFNRRGLYPVAGAPEYDAWLNEITDESVDTSNYVFETKARDSLVLAAFQLGTAAHRMLVDIETAIADLEFRAAKAAVQGALYQAQAATSLYNAEVLIFRGHVATYNALAATVIANAQAFEILAQEVRILGQVNATTASAFSAAERAKLGAARTFRAQVDAEAAKLVQYRAYLESYEAQVQSARSAVEQFRGDVTRYAAEMERVSDEYDLYASNARVTQQENAALVAGLQADQIEIRSVASKAEASAAEAAAKAIELQAKAAVNETVYIKRALHNGEEGVSLNQQASGYNIEMSNYVAELTSEAAKFTGISAEARAISSYVTSASDAVGRAASLTQTANIQLASAYEEVYKAAGRAGAAVASGKLSGFRASATMAARENLNASRAYGVVSADQGSKTYAESDQYSANISV